MSSADSIVGAGIVVGSLGEFVVMARKPVTLRTTACRIVRTCPVLSDEMPMMISSLALARLRHLRFAGMPPLRHIRSRTRHV
jgi:hypothetical protein